MRSIRIAIAAIALSVTASASAGTTAGQQVTLTNGISDHVATNGTFGVTFTALGAGQITGNPTLTYSTHASSAANRKVTVSGSLPAGVTGTVAFTPDNGKGTSMNAVALDSSATDFISSIPAFITQDAKALTYTFTAAHGFVTDTITITYTIADE